MSGLIPPERFALRRGFREAELYGFVAAHQRSWGFGNSGDIGLRYAYRVGIERFRELARLRPIGPAGPGSAA